MKATPMRIFFLSNYNRCRSQIAARLVAHYGGAHVRVDSGGIEPKIIDPLTIQVMNEAGVPLLTESGWAFDILSILEADLVIVCCDDKRESCPVFPTGVAYELWNIPDPYTFVPTTTEELMEVIFKIKGYIEQVFEKYNIPMHGEPSHSSE
ncbi:low molecular weight phosphatase family protein [Paenibacillus sp. IHB B 3415]|uniref:arsenate reductase/protein-tyrosine-phosphatase family protein n=1 Tax=Paenibacillus sp. IHB B 3415 TaxID=867080 RepID=UPI00069A620D|nr:low molecular weight phosphatase family protein [Paenibacillus sp. IHB B 3415]